MRHVCAYLTGDRNLLSAKCLWLPNAPSSDGRAGWSLRVTFSTALAQYRFQSRLEARVVRIKLNCGPKFLSGADKVSRLQVGVGQPDTVPRALPRG
jgi:hypothetical protein